MKKGIIFIIVYLVFSISFILFNNSKKYIILNNDYMFRVKNDSLESVKKYPANLNNSKINYYNNSLKNKGFINIKTKKLEINQVIGNNIDTYTQDYKKIIGSNMVVTSGIDKLDLVNLNNIRNTKLNNDDKELLKNNSIININDINYFEKYIFDFNNDNVEDTLYIISDFVFKEDNYIDSYDNFNQVALLYSNGNFNTIFEHKATTELYTLNNIFDLNNDNIYEINFNVEDMNDFYYSCQSIFMNYIEYKNCNMDRGGN